MNYARSGHSSCSFKQHVYVIAGDLREDFKSQPIEHLDIKAGGTQWDTILMQAPIFKRPLVHAISKEGILITGGER